VKLRVHREFPLAQFVRTSNRRQDVQSEGDGGYVRISTAARMGKRSANFFCNPTPPEPPETPIPEPCRAVSVARVEGAVNRSVFAASNRKPRHSRVQCVEGCIVVQVCRLFLCSIFILVWRMRQCASTKSAWDSPSYTRRRRRFCSPWWKTSHPSKRASTPFHNLIR
jgi:hypothetical protein